MCHRQTESTVKIVGVIAIVLGALALGYGGFRYAWPDEVASVGPVHVVVERHENVLLPPALGAVSLAVGIGLLIFGLRSTRT